MIDITVVPSTRSFSNFALVNVPPPGRTHTAALFILIIISAALFTAVGYSYGFESTHVTIALPVFAGISIVIVIAMEAQKRSPARRQPVLDFHGQSLEVLAVQHRAHCLHESMAAALAGWRHFAISGISSGKADKTVVLSWSSTFENLKPFEFSLDPIPVREASEEFAYVAREMYGIDKKSGVRIKPPAAFARSRKTMFHRQNAKKSDHYLRLFHVFVGVLAVVLAIAFGRVDDKHMVWGAIGLIGLYLAARKRPHRWRNQWFTVDGGMCLINGESQPGMAKCHVFDRRKSLLVACQFRQAIWLVAVADRTAHDCRAVNSNELLLLLSAWLSPIDPPSLDELMDFE